MRRTDWKLNEDDKLMNKPWTCIRFIDVLLKFEHMCTVLNSYLTSEFI